MHHLLGGLVAQPNRKLAKSNDNLNELALDFLGVLLAKHFPVPHFTGDLEDKLANRAEVDNWFRLEDSLRVIAVKDDDLPNDVLRSIFEDI